VCIIPDPVSYSIFSLPQPLKEGKRQDPVREETERGNKPKDKPKGGRKERNICKGRRKQQNRSTKNNEGSIKP
jgi:hypothetical protein